MVASRVCLPGTQGSALRSGWFDQTQVHSRRWLWPGQNLHG